MCFYGEKLTRTSQDLKMRPAFFVCLFFSGQIFNKHSSQMRLKQDSMLFILVYTVLMGTQGCIIQPVRKSH